MTNQGKLLTKHKVPWFVVCLELTLVNLNQWFKNIFLLLYLFIAILCVKMCRMNKALHNHYINCLKNVVWYDNTVKQSLFFIERNETIKHEWCYKFVENLWLSNIAVFCIIINMNGAINLLKIYDFPISQFFASLLLKYLSSYLSVR